jgi:RNA polymerase sigma-70 factor, ECF subfamily
MEHRSTADLIALRPKLMRRARRLGLSGADAEDVAQDVLLSALASGCALSGAELEAWCCVAVRNRVINLQKSAWTRMTTSLEDGDVFVSPPEQEHVVLLSQIGAALKTMPARVSGLIKRISMEGWSMAEAAKADGVPLGTIQSRLNRALAMLRRNLDPGSRRRAV